MPFARPSLSELVTRIRGDLRGRLEIDGPLLRRAMADALGAVWAGATHTMHGFLQFLAAQLFGDTADRAFLLRLAKMYGIVPAPATLATRNVTVTGTNGSTVLNGNILRLDAVTSYRVTTGATIVSGTGTVVVTAVLAGSLANVPVGTALTFESPVAGVNVAATVAAGGLDGNDEEGTEEVRDRYLLRKREPPTGSSDQDYIAFALAVPGVTRAWAFPLEQGLGTVVVRFVRDNDAVTIFPDAGEIAAVQAALNSQRPTTAVAVAAATTGLAVPFTIHLSPDTTDARVAIAAELADLLRRRAEPGDGAGRGTILLSEITTSIGVAAGGADYVLTVPSANVVPGVGQLATLGTIAWA